MAAHAEAVAASTGTADGAEMSDERVSVGLTLKGWEWFRRDKQAHEELAQIRAEGLRPMTDQELQQWRAREFNAERKIEEIQAELQSDDDTKH